MVPVPLRPDGAATPIDALIDPGGLGGETGPVPGLPFPHAVAACEPGWPDSPPRAARECLELYRAMLHRLGLVGKRTDLPGQRPAPYNLLATRGWLLVVPRSREFVGPISINALGFAGSLLARDEAELELIRRRGPMELLREASRP
jgi:ATP adenylyltransferase